MDWIVTERGIYRRNPEGLALLGEPVAGEPSALASPVCDAAEVDPGISARGRNRQLVGSKLSRSRCTTRRY